MIRTAQGAPRSPKGRSGAEHGVAVDRSKRAPVQPDVAPLMVAQMVV
jgi:hypothetical protein